MSKEPVQAWLFAVVVVRKADKFLLVHERKHGQLWYLPAGRVELGETFQIAAVRETAEEAGLPIALRGIVRWETSPTLEGLRLRVVFYAEPTDDTPPKAVADEHSLEAGWFSLEELDRLPLRGPDVRDYLEHVAHGGLITPLAALSDERIPIAMTDLAPPSLRVTDDDDDGDDDDDDD